MSIKKNVCTESSQITFSSDKKIHKLRCKNIYRINPLSCYETPKSFFKQDLVLFDSLNGNFICRYYDWDIPIKFATLDGNMVVE